VVARPMPVDAPEISAQESAMLHLDEYLCEGCVCDEFVAGLFLAGAQSLWRDWR